MVWKEAREIIWRYRRRVAFGLVVMVIGRLAGLVPPASSKYLIDDVVGQGRGEMLVPLALVVAVATLVQGAGSFLLSRILGVTAQRAITEMRKTVQAHVARLPVGYFDSTKSGVLISRVMTDAEGIRNLVGHRSRAARRRRGHVGDLLRDPAVPQLAADRLHHRCAAGVRRRHGIRIPAAEAALPRTGPHQRGGDRDGSARVSRGCGSSRPTRRSAGRTSSSRRGAHRLLRNVAAVGDGGVGGDVLLLGDHRL